MKSRAIVIAMITPFLYACASQVTPEVQPKAQSASSVKQAVAETFVANHTLMRNCDEAGFYGLYSYVLVASVPSNNQYLEFVESLKLFIQKSRRVAIHNRKADEDYMNNTYIPIWSAPPAWVKEVNVEDSEQLDAAARWVALNYDYQCAKKIIRKIPSLNKSDLYVVSSLTKLARENNATDMIIQRIREAGEDIDFPLIEEYYKKTWHQRHWNRSSIILVSRLLRMSLSGEAIREEDLGIPISGYLAGTMDDELSEEVMRIEDTMQSDLNDDKRITLILHER